MVLARGVRRGMLGIGATCRRRQAAWRQAAEQTRWRPTGVKGCPQTGHGVVSPTLRDGSIGSSQTPKRVIVPGRRAAAGLAHPEGLAVGDDDDGVVE